jgi:signal transduction histidine kinase
MFGIRGYHLIDIIPIAHQVIIANLTNTGVLATDKNKRIIEINPKAREYLFPAYTQKIIGKELIPLLYSQEHLQSQIFEEIQQIDQIFLSLDSKPNVLKSFEIELITPIESERKFLKIIIETLQEREKPIGTILFLLDITAEKEIQEAERKRNDLRDSLLGVISHDLKNELFVITGFTEVLREELERQKNQQELVEFLEGIDAKVEKAASIITDVRSYLKTVGAFDTTISPTKIDVRKVLTSSLSGFEDLIDKKKLTLNTEFFRDEVFILADLRIRSVFTNLVDNAIKWSPDGGTINISIDEQDHFWVIKISDQGSGVPDELKDIIFKPFTAFGKEKNLIGSGLGLALVSEILNHYNGSIWVEDNTPSGANFCVKLPIYRDVI